MEKSRVVITNSFLPAGMKAKKVNAPRGRINKLISSARPVGKGDKKPDKSSAVKITPVLIQFMVQLGWVRSN